jgi:hypothetical protein
MLFASARASLRHSSTSAALRVTDSALWGFEHVRAPVARLGEQRLRLLLVLLALAIGGAMGSLHVTSTLRSRPFVSSVHVIALQSTIGTGM